MVLGKIYGKDNKEDLKLRSYGHGHLFAVYKRVYLVLNNITGYITGYLLAKGLFISSIPFPVPGFYLCCI